MRSRTQWRSKVRSAQRRPFWSWSSLFPVLVVAGLVGFLLWTEHRNDESWRALEREEEARVAARRAELPTKPFDALWDQCQAAWSEGLSIYWWPSAVVWTREGLLAYFVAGDDRSSLRQVHCDARGVRRGVRIARPLLELLPAEQLPPATAGSPPAATVLPPGLTDAFAEPQGNEDPEGGGVRRVLHRFAGQVLTGDELAVELLAHPVTDTAIVRRWRGVEGGAVATVEPADAPAFPLLVAAKAFPLAAGVELPPRREIARFRWVSESERAFARIAEVLPAEAGISELTLTEDAIEITIAAPTPAFDGKPPAPFGDLDLDEYGVAEQSWWYPYEEPGFGCRDGRPLSEVAAAFAEARARFSGKPQRAWYSCSTAYSDGRRGVWHLS